MFLSRGDRDHGDAFQTHPAESSLESPPGKDGARGDGSLIPGHTKALSDKTLLPSLHVLTFHSSQKKKQEYPQVCPGLAPGISLVNRGLP